MLNIFGHKGNANQNYTEIQFTPVRMAVINNTAINADEDVGGRNTSTLLWESKLVQPLWKAIWMSFKK
jgi:hypothetical protein